jgi:hypothetical protein
MRGLMPPFVSSAAERCLTATVVAPGLCEDEERAFAMGEKYFKYGWRGHF